jgi:hypothetical protein
MDEIRKAQEYPSLIPDAHFLEFKLLMVSFHLSPAD